MNLLGRRALVLLAVALPIPFFFNSCNGNLLGGGTFASSTCSVGLEQRRLVDLKQQALPSVFAQKKSRLTADQDVKQSAARGDTFVALLDTICPTPTARAAPITARLLATLPSSATSAPDQSLPAKRAVLWTADRDYSADELEAALKDEPCIQGLAPNHVYKVQSLSFNDPSQSSQTYLGSDNAFPAWNGFYGGNPVGMPLTGTPVVVAVIDTGVDYTHPDLKSQMWAGGALGIGVDVPSYTTANGANYYPVDVSPEGHGTHVSGMIAAAGNNAIGIIGLMPYRATIMSLRLFGLDAGGNLTSTSQNFFTAVHFAISNHAQVINLSLDEYTAGPATDAVAEQAINDALAAGITVVTAIGNASTGNGVLIDGQTNSSLPGMFAAKPGVIGVGAYDTGTLQKSFFSDYSPVYAEIGAPGAESSTTGLISTVPTNLGSYARLMGTSQAAPQVTAAAALTIGLIRNSYAVSPTPAEVERLILLSAKSNPALTPYFKNGNYLDLQSLLATINQQYPLTATGGHADLGCH